MKATNGAPKHAVARWYARGLDAMSSRIERDLNKDAKRAKRLGGEYDGEAFKVFSRGVLRSLIELGKAAERLREMFEEGGIK